jgi:hypothetical protein
MKNYYAERIWKNDIPPAKFDGLDGIVTPNVTPIGVYGYRPEQPKSGNGVIKGLLSIIAIAAVFTASSVIRHQNFPSAENHSYVSAEPEPGSEEAVIEWLMESWRVNRSYANLQYDSDPAGMTHIYNILSPHGRYYGLGHGRGSKSPLEQ